MGGKFVGSAKVGPGEDYIVYVTSDDCSKPDVAPIARQIANKENGTFFTEVFVPCGTDLHLCAAIETENLDAKPQPTARWGHLGRKLHAEGEGEITFFNLEIAIEPASQRTFLAPPKQPLQPMP
jgi:hypothetical protein